MEFNNLAVNPDASTRAVMHNLRSQLIKKASGKAPETLLIQRGFRLFSYQQRDALDPLTIIAIVLGLGIVTVLMFFDEALDRLLNPVLSVFGLGTSIGPLSVSLVRDDSFLEMTILNNGKTKAVIAGLEIRDSQGKRFFLHLIFRKRTCLIVSKRVVKRNLERSWP